MLVSCRLRDIAHVTVRVLLVCVCVRVCVRMCVGVQLLYGGGRQQRCLGGGKTVLLQHLPSSPSVTVTLKPRLGWRYCVFATLHALSHFDLPMHIHIQVYIYIVNWAPPYAFIPMHLSFMGGLRKHVRAICNSSPACPQRSNMCLLLIARPRLVYGYEYSVGY